MDRVIFENVRCFHEMQSLPLRPITLLVGENSSGKSTFLALVRAAWDIAFGYSLQTDFNEEPFVLGAFDQIANFRGGKGGRARAFTIGVEIEPRSVDRVELLEQASVESVRILGRYEEEKSHPVLKEWIFEAGPYHITSIFGTKGNRAGVGITVTSPSGEWENEIETEMWGPLSFLPYLLSRQPREERIGQSSDEEEIVRAIIATVARLTNMRPNAFAPIRTSPQRTYDPVKDLPKPEGSHIPMLLSRIVSSESEWQPLHNFLREFGRQSGLFRDIEVKRKGSKPSDPFQIMVKVAGTSFNLVDVGYGVSQVLPIIVDASQGRRGSTYLLQQPEVHLHPKAQAALGTFLGVLAKQDQKRFVIETHSDYLVDRVRMDVRDGRLTPGDVAILYFERDNGGVQIHSLDLDAYGNIINAPPGYRGFFLEETERLLMG